MSHENRPQARTRLPVIAGLLAAGSLAAASVLAAAPAAADRQPPLQARPSAAGLAPAPAKARPATPRLSEADARAERLATIGRVKSWGYQLSELDLARAKASPYDLLVVDATAGLRDSAGFTADEVASLKRKPDGSRRLVVSYLSIGEAEDYRAYYDPEYMREDAPDWLLKENPRWKGNRLINLCEPGWERTILGDDNGRSLYNDIDPSPLYKLIELGFDGVYLDRVDVYAEVGKQCPDAAEKAVAFVAKLSAHAHKRDPRFLVILQNAEELLRRKAMVDAIDAVAKEDLIHGPDDDGHRLSVEETRSIVANLNVAKAAGRSVLVVDYPRDKAGAVEARRRIEAEGFVPYIAPRKLDQLRLPGVDF